MMELANIFARFQEGTQASQGMLDGLWAWFSQLNVGSAEWSVLGVAALLVLVWLFVRMVRMVVGILIAVCILLLVLQLAGVVDASSVWVYVQNWLAEPSAAAPAPRGW